MSENKKVWYLKALKRAYAWKILEEEFMERISEIENVVLENFKTSNELKFTENDLLKVERKLLKQFIELPDNLLNALEIIEIKEEQE